MLFDKQFFKFVGVWVVVLATLVFARHVNRSGRVVESHVGVVKICQNHLMRGGLIQRAEVRLASGKLVTIETNTCSELIGMSVPVDEKREFIGKRVFYVLGE